MALFLAVLGGPIGAVSFTGSLVAFAKLQDLAKRGALFPKAMQKQIMTAGLVVFAVLALVMVFIHPYGPVVFLFFVLALGFGVIMTMPIGGADMPVVISLYNALDRLGGRPRGVRARQRGHDHCRHRGRLGRYAC